MLTGDTNDEKYPPGSAPDSVAAVDCVASTVTADCVEDRVDKKRR